MRKTILAAATAVALLGIASAAPAATPAAGTAETTISVLSVQAAGQTVDVLTGNGLATTDPVRRSLSSVLARTGMTVAKIGSTSIGEVAAVADNDPATPAGTADAAGAETVSVNDPLAEASLFVGAREARVEDLLALSRLGQLSLDADVLQGLLALDGVSINLSDSSTVEKAVASQAVSIKSLDVLPLAKILDLLTTLSADSLVALADGIAPGASAPVKTARDTLVDTINGLLPPGIGPISASLTIDQTITEVESLVATLPLLGPVVNPLLRDLKDRIAALRQLIGAIDLLSVENLRAGVTAEALDTASSAAADLVAWDAVRVAGIALPSSATVGGAIDAVRSKVNDVVGLLRQVTGLSGLNVVVDVLDKTEKTSVDGVYRVAEAGITGLNVEVSLPQVSGLTGGLDLKARVLSLSAMAEHRAAGTSPAPAGTVGTLPLTGADDTALLALGLLFVVGGFASIRWPAARSR